MANVNLNPSSTDVSAAVSQKITLAAVKAKPFAGTEFSANGKSFILGSKNNKVVVIENNRGDRSVNTVVFENPKQGLGVDSRGATQKAFTQDLLAGQTKMPSAAKNLMPTKPANAAAASAEKPKPKNKTTLDASTSTAGGITTTKAGVTIDNINGTGSKIRVGAEKAENGREIGVVSGTFPVWGDGEATGKIKTSPQGSAIIEGSFKKPLAKSKSNGVENETTVTGGADYNGDTNAASANAGISVKTTVPVSPSVNVTNEASAKISTAATGGVIISAKDELGASYKVTPGTTLSATLTSPEVGSNAPIGVFKVETKLSDALKASASMTTVPAGGTTNEFSVDWKVNKDVDINASASNTNGVNTYKAGVKIGL